MSFDLLALWVLGIVAFLTHLGTMWMLHACRQSLSVLSGGVGSSAEELREWSGDISQSLTEVCAIGSDLADLLESLADGLDRSQNTASAGPVDVPSTILSLIASRLMPDLDGGQTGQEWAIYEQQENAAPVFDVEGYDDDATPTEG